MKTFLLVIISFLAFACKTEKIMTDAEMAKTEKTDDKRLKIVASLGDKVFENDLYSITNIRMEENTMLIDINYSGGCEKHVFKVIGLPLNSQSVQPIRQIQLVHLSNNDRCKKMISQTLEIDMKEIVVNNAVGSKSIFKIDGWKDQLEYIAQ